MANSAGFCFHYQNVAIHDPLSGFLISRCISESVTLKSPRLFEKYWETAASVIPSFSAAFLWVRPWSLIKLFANSFLMSGRRYQTFPHNQS